MSELNSLLARCRKLTLTYLGIWVAAVIVSLLVTGVVAASASASGSLLLVAGGLAAMVILLIGSQALWYVISVQRRHRG